MEKRIKAEIAIMIILSVAILIGGTLWLESQMNDSSADASGFGVSSY